ncbi:hypothetical protein KKH56_07035 [bacterium]|nr:hypothetical protein [bacterium]
MADEIWKTSCLNDFQALAKNTTGWNNTALGYQANLFNETGSNNTILGYQAGMGTFVHNKSGNVFLGYQASYNETGSNKLYIENSPDTPLIYGEFDNDYLKVNGDFVASGIITSGSSITIDGTSNTITTTGDTIGFGGEDLATTGTVVATAFVGDGSGLTNIAGTADSDWVESGGNVYRETGNVGIGTTGPLTKLHVSGGDINLDLSQALRTGAVSRWGAIL